MLRENFDRDSAIEARVCGAIDLTHPARAERGLNLVGTEFYARSQRHDMTRRAIIWHRRSLAALLSKDHRALCVALVSIRLALGRCTILPTHQCLPKSVFPISS